MSDLVRVTGRGEAVGVPDRARVVVQVSHDSPDVGEALQRVGMAARTAVDVAERHGVGPAHRQTVATSLQPVRNPERWEQVVAHRAAQRLALEVTDLAALGPLLGELARAVPGLAIDEVGLAVGDVAALTDEARQRAMADARHRAEQLASLAGRELGHVRTVDELGGTGGSGPVPRTALAAAAGPAVEAGTHAVTVLLEVSFALAEAGRPDQGSSS